MAIDVIDATVGTPTANSFVDVDYALDYWERHWSLIKKNLFLSLKSEQQELLLIAASRVINGFAFTANLTYPIPGQTSSAPSIIPLIGDLYAYELNRHLLPVRFNPLQNLQFPRNKDTDENGANPFVPDAVKMAVCEQAVYMQALDESALTAQMQGIRSEQMSVGNGQFSQSVQYTGLGTELAPQAYEYLKDLFWRNTPQVMR